MNKIIDLSLCIICKDDAENLEYLLNKAKDWFDDIVVVDTGSSDGSNKIAQKLGANVISGNHLISEKTGYVKSFAEARELSFAKAKNDWVMWLDSDDDLSNWMSLPHIFSEMKAKSSSVGYAVCADFEYLYSWNHDRSVCTQKLRNKPRIVKKSDGWYWCHPIHESIRTDRAKEMIYFESQKVIHRSAGARGHQKDRNLNILLEWGQTELSKADRCVYHYYVADEFLARKQFKSAHSNFIKSYEFRDKQRQLDNFYQRTAFRSIISIMKEDVSLSDVDESIKIAMLKRMRAYLRQGNNNSHIWTLMAIFHLSLGNKRQTKYALKKSEHGNLLDGENPLFVLSVNDWLKEQTTRIWRVNGGKYKYVKQIVSDTRKQMASK